MTLRSRLLRNTSSPRALSYWAYGVPNTSCGKERTIWKVRGLIWCKPKDKLSLNLPQQPHLYKRLPMNIHTLHC